LPPEVNGAFGSFDTRRDTLVVILKLHSPELDIDFKY
jgi:hypothetical protein